MGSAAVKLAQSVGYQNAGTMEFLVDREGHYYFIEMNTRIQVEHTITEEVYGCDLVKEQIRIAAGEKLSPHMEHATPRLHAIQCRINAEDPAKNFQPSPGKLLFTTRRVDVVFGWIRTLTLATSFRRFTIR